MLTDVNVMRDLTPPKYEDNKKENPKKFIQEVEEIMSIRGIPEEWKKLWFRKCMV